VNVSASFADAGTFDTHTAVWDWGDATSSVGTVSETNGAGTVSGSHVYTAAGVYTVTLTVTDDDGAATQSVFEYVVVYNPDGGFVTGGGWIDSPAGALVGNPSATGKAHLALVSKYQRGAHVPDGNTKFKFAAGDFVFESSSYDWLVISGAKARYRGTGTVNGAGNYGFQITLIDGDRPGGGGTDRFRIKIWDRNNGNALVYDNQAGAGDDADPNTALGGGNIRIQV
jgi:PKD repeat protein